MALRKDNKGRALQPGESQRADGTYMYRYTDLFHKRQYIYAKTIKELREKKNELIARDFLGVQNKSMSQLKVIDLIDRYVSLSATKRKSTRRNYKTARNFVSRYPIGEMYATRITADAFKRWIIDLCDEGYAISTVRNMARIVKLAFNSAVDDGILLRSPINIKIDFIPPSAKRKALTQDELASLYEFLKADPHYCRYLDLTIVLAETGMRMAEFAGLTIKDIDFEKNTINIYKQLCGKAKDDLYVEAPKSAMGERVIPMNPDVRASMQRIVEQTKRCKEQRTIGGYTGFLNVFLNGSLRHSSAYDDIYARICNKYNKTHSSPIKVTPHILRHTFCTNAAQSGMTIPSLQYLMGHASATTTLQTYTHTNKNRAIQEFSEMYCELESPQKDDAKLTPIHTPNSVKMRRFA